MEIHFFLRSIEVFVATDRARSACMGEVYKWKTFDGHTLIRQISRKLLYDVKKIDIEL